MESYENSPCNGCEAGCCKNMYGFLTNEELVQMQSTNTIFIVELEEFMNIQRILVRGKATTQGIYAYKSNNDCEGYSIIIAGPCENINSDGSCNIYNKRPLMCQEFDVGSRECNFIKHGNVITLDSIE